MAITLSEYQKDAVSRLKTGSILCGGVGSGKSRTGLAYYFTQEGGSIDPYKRMKKHPRDLYIITTAQKRDKLEWEGELAPFLLSSIPEKNDYYGNTVVVDSWNNIKKYSDIKGAFFIFDEQRVVGSGAWSKAFLKISKWNDWILLSATPGDKWEDYIPVFIANGFYRTRSEFVAEHLVYSRYVKYKIERYTNTGRLIRLRNSILIDMDCERKTIPHHEDIYCNFDVATYKDTMKTRTNPFVKGYIPCLKNDPGALLVGTDILVEDVTPIMKGWTYNPKIGDYVRLAKEPIKNAPAFCYTLRKIVNTDISRQKALLDICERHPRVIIFYNFDYELDILKGLNYEDNTKIAEWNGHQHQPLPEGKRWIYLVQYTAGAEGWNCIKTDTIVFFSQNYSYKIMQQSSGRIDRLNTPYTDLYYYHLKSRSGIDLAISKALNQKKKFNEKKFAKWE